MKNNKTKKILMYTNDKIYTTVRMTGGIRRFKMLYEGLINDGYDVTLYCGETKETLSEYNKKAYSVQRDDKKTKLFAGIGIFLKNKKLIKNLKKENYDEIIVFDVPTAIGLCLNKMNNINLFMRQDLVEYRKVMLEEKKKNKLYKLLYLKIMNYCEYICCKRSKRIIVQCQYDLNNLINRHKKIGNIIKNKSNVQINNVDAKWIVDKSKNKIEHAISKEKFNICFIGDFSSNRKGHDIFLSAVDKLMKDKLNVRAYLIGDGLKLDEVKKQYSKNNDIVFLGRMNNPIDIIKQSNLVVVPSRADSCPNTVLESLYNNVLVIGSNAGGIPEILNDNDALFELNEDSLYNKICNLYNNNDNLNNLKNNQNKRREELCFDWVKKIEKILMGENK